MHGQLVAAVAKGEGPGAFDIRAFLFQMRGDTIPLALGIWNTSFCCLLNSPWHNCSQLASFHLANNTIFGLDRSPSSVSSFFLHPEVRICFWFGFSIHSSTGACDRLAEAAERGQTE